LGTPAPAPATAGLTDLDRQRAASLADEGGASGAALERQEPAPVPGRRSKPWGLAAFAVGLFAAWRLARRR
jgi:MYXO-CTERM domain-containing protein